MESQLGFHSKATMALLLINCPWAYCVGSSLNSLFVCLLSVRPSVVRPSVRVTLSFEPKIIRKHSSTWRFALKNTSVWDIFRKHAEYVTVQMSRLLKFRDLPTQSVQGPPLPCGCNLVWYWLYKRFTIENQNPSEKFPNVFFKIWFLYEK